MPLCRMKNPKFREEKMQCRCKYCNREKATLAQERQDKYSQAGGANLAQAWTLGLQKEVESMSLQFCTLSWQAFTTCASHAMSTEKQEVMGLLLGRWGDGSREGNTVMIDHAMILTRTDKQEDRVEVGYKQLAEASSIAERMSAQLGRDTRVVGWYHSHPHITVLPSHVDVRTQGQYQSMDKRFIGLIFSVFSEDRQSKVGTIEVTAFQARNTSEMLDLDAGDGAGVARARSAGGPAGWERTEVALSLHSPGPGSSTTPLSDALERVVRLQDTLFGEERAAYLKALRQHNDDFSTEGEELGDGGGDESRQGQGVDLLSKLFCSAVYSKSLASLTADSAAPLAQTLRSQLTVLKKREAALVRRHEELRSWLSPAELEEASSHIKSRMRDPCSAVIGAFQVHEGEQDIPRADALRFARHGCRVRKFRVLRGTSTVATYRVFREYPKTTLSSKPGVSPPGAEDLPENSLATSIWDTSAGSVETSEERETGGGMWVLDAGGRKHVLRSIRADPSRRRGLLFMTESGEIDATCEDQEAFRMWLGVGAAVCPSLSGSHVQ